MKTINYPKSWADVKLSQYLNFYKQIKPYINTPEYVDRALLFGIFNFTNITDEEYKNLLESDFSKLQIQIGNLLNTTEKISLVKSFEMDGVTYGFIPALDEMTYGEYLDLVAYSKKDMWDNIPTLMGILYRPITKSVSKSYTIELYNGTDEDQVELFSRALTMDIVFGALSFFLHLQADLLKGTLTYSMGHLMKSKDPRIIAAREDLLKNGTDITQLQSLQTMMLQNLTL